MSTDILSTAQAEVRRALEVRPLPNARVEEWKYVDTSVLKSYSDLGLGRAEQIDAVPDLGLGSESAKWVMCNGQYDEAKSQSFPGARIGRLTEIDSAELNPLVDDMKRQGDLDYFAAASLGAFSDGMHIEFTEQSSADHAPELHLLGGGELSRSENRVHIRVKSGIEAQLIVNLTSLANGVYFGNTQISLELEKAARLNLCIWSNDLPDTIHVGGVYAKLMRDSYLNCSFLSEGSKLSRQRVQIDLLEENAEANVFGAGIMNERCQQHIWLEMNHCVSQCRSNQLFKNILDGEGRSSFDATVHVHEKASGNTAGQMNHNLVLSKNARASFKPQMKIYNDDVVAQHGATAGQLDPAEIFYMKSRGLDEALSKHLLARGFIDEVIRELPGEALRRAYTKRVLDRHFPVGNKT